MHNIFTYYHKGIPILNETLETLLMSLAYNPSKRKSPSVVKANLAVPYDPIVGTTKSTSCVGLVENLATAVPMAGNVPKDPLSHSTLFTLENLKG